MNEDRNHTVEADLDSIPKKILTLPVEADLDSIPKKILTLLEKSHYESGLQSFTEF